MVSDQVNLFAAFRFALSYPSEQHLEYFGAQASSLQSPRSLSELRSLYISLFEAGLPHPKCPLLESFYVDNRPAPEVVLENKLFYKHFGLQLHGQAAPDSLLAQLEFLAWLDHCIDAGNPDRESLERARRDFIDRNLAWVPKAAERLDSTSEPYHTVMSMLAEYLALPIASSETD